MPLSAFDENYIMSFLKFNKRPILSFSFALIALTAFSQKMTIVKGVIIDAETKETLPLVNLAFSGTNIGTTSDFDGTYILESKWASDSIQVSYVGYETQTIKIQLGVRQEVNIALNPISLALSTVEIKARKGGYRRKDNPAVELWKNVMEHKDENRIQSQAYYEYDKYEKIQFDLNNFDPEKLKNRRFLRKFGFILDYVDTSDINGKPFLPFFIQEASSKVFYRKDPKGKKEFREGVNVTGMEDYVDLQDFTTMLELLYQNVDIYQDNIKLLDIPFMSPLSPLANAYYRFYITDTMAIVNEHECMKLSFMPINNQNMAFKGDLYVLKDSSFQVIKADLGITKQINLNFVQDIHLLQEFRQVEGVWVMEKDRVVIDFALLKKGTGVFGTRTVSYKDFSFNIPRDDSHYIGTENVIDSDDAYKKPVDFWVDARHDTLSQKEVGIYQMIDTLKRLPTFRTIMNIGKLMFTGYKDVGAFDVGPVGSFYSFNPVEGLRLKFGGETNLKFLPKTSFAGFLAYGFNDAEWKYGGSVMHSFRDDFKVNPKHYFKLSYQNDVLFVGDKLHFTSQDNFLHSFKRGTVDRMLFIEKYAGQYYLELDNSLSWDISFENTSQKPIGSIHFNYYDPKTSELKSLPEIQVSQLNFTMRFAPNEQYVQGRTYRIPFYNKYPVLTFNASLGFKDMLGGEFSYQKASLNLFKRFYLSFLGTMRFETEVGKIWGDGVPYFLLHLPKANQTFSLRTTSYNMMNYMEFVSDEYFTWNIEHYFNGFVFNKIPFLRKAKLREVISFKGIYGRLTDGNNPHKNKSLIQFITDEKGDSFTYTLEDKPYIEISAGISNILKFARIDLVRRMTYLDNPEVPQLFNVKGLGIRIKLQASF